MNGDDDMCLSDERNERQLNLGDAFMMLSALRERDLGGGEFVVWCVCVFIEVCAFVSLSFNGRPETELQLLHSLAIDDEHNNNKF